MTMLVKKNTQIRSKVKSVDSMFNEKGVLTFKEEVKKIMLKQGANKRYIEKYLTDVAVLNAMNLKCSAEDLAWILLH